MAALALDFFEIARHIFLVVRTGNDCVQVRGLLNDRQFVRHKHLHRTLRGRIVAPEYQEGEDELATGQFEVSDDRSPAEIAAVLQHHGLDPVWKDWDQALQRA